ncbi:hypothetical protein KSC_104890 [Ktedonobacter sp. SOSP1-52]|uniref:APC family permease n=1 Tax=Ktedonobacter sp. SOSP1-52 TaxID=2778366 RepID=UPI001916536D|nr:APC family permease [Ktedonobacter sp. SOSP1-52]GHO71597.1 hypothetical protein KSC_104890 [Ktedonobacter sp. SOSP1-52]
MLIFASNTAIIGAYHVFLALARMGFLPTVVLRRNRLRGTPHVAIALAAGIPIAVLLLVSGNIVVLGDMYAFGLLGAFTLTCIGLDIVRRRDWRHIMHITRRHTAGVPEGPQSSRQGQASLNGHAPRVETPSPMALPPSPSSLEGAHTHEIPSHPQKIGIWFRINFFLGLVTTLLVASAWCINLVTKPLATAFGGGATVVGMVVAYVNIRRIQQRGMLPIPVALSRLPEPQPQAIVAVLLEGEEQNEAVSEAAVRSAQGQRPLLFLYLCTPQRERTAPRLLEIVDPYLQDQGAKEAFGRAERLAQQEQVPHRQYVYWPHGRETLPGIWHLLCPYDTVLPSTKDGLEGDINPDRIRYNTHQQDR